MIAFYIALLPTVLLLRKLRRWYIKQKFSSNLKKNNKNFKVIIIGCGFSGICMGIQLKQQLNFNNFVIYEKEPSFGGTWWLNTYPGCACDVNVRLYSYSFENNYGWTCLFPKQKEILNYLTHCVNKYGIMKHIKLNHNVTSCVWNKDTNKWDLKVVKNGKEEFEDSSNVIVVSTGPLNIPVFPEQIKGMTECLASNGDHNNNIWHSQKYNHNFDVSNKVVGIIGTGPSSIQIAPEVSKKCSKLIIYQRSFSYLFPKMDFKYPKLLILLLKYFPIIRRFTRILTFLFSDFIISQILFNDKSLPYWYAKKLSIDFRDKSLKTLNNKKVKDLMTPKYKLGCKRMLLSDDWYPMLCKKSTIVTNDKIKEIKRIKDNKLQITCENEKHTLDALICATGFVVQQVKLYPLEIIGLNNKDLREIWSKSPEAYYGITVNKYPNMFITVGPNTGLGHNSIIFMIECQFMYPKLNVQREHNKFIQEKLKNSSWADKNCKSWYKNEKGEITAIWYSTCTQYWLETRKINKQHFVVE